MRKLFTALLFVSAVLLFSASAKAQGFNIQIPTIPQPPIISDVGNTPAATDLAVTVKATVTPQEQLTVYCPNGDNPFEDCEMEELQLAPESSDRLPENPPPIVKATVYYYLNGENGSQQSADMSYNAQTQKWEGTIPGQPQGTIVTYYIAASDAVGNVASMARVLADGPAFPNWDPEAATPAYDNCSLADYHLVCSEVEQASPNCSTIEFTVNDPFGSNYDTCGNPDSDGKQELQSGLAKNDMRGLSAWADGNNISLSLGLNASPPTPSDAPPIDAYIFLLLNPDIQDPNPYDLNFTNGFAITYAAEAQGTDPTLVKVLWNAGCMFTSGDPLSCKLLTSTSSSDLQISGASDDTAVRIQVKRSKSNYTLVGEDTGGIMVISLSGNIDIVSASGAMNDQLPGLMYYYRQGEYEVTGTPPPGPVDILTQKCDQADKTCVKSSSQPAKNTCTVTFLTSDVLADHYDVYKSTSPTSQGSVVETITRADGTTNYTFDEDHTTLDGKTYYYQVVAIGDPVEGFPDGQSSSAAKAQCSIEDWVAPVISTAVSNLSCETPDGRKGVLQIAWNSDTVTDPSLAGFYVQRGSTRLNFSTPVGVVKNDNTYEYTYTDNGGDLEEGKLTVGETYPYTITVFDRGNNEATTTSKSCTPTDRQPPEQVETLLPSLIGGEAAVKLAWQAPDLEKEQNDDIVGYNVYRCYEEVKNVSCIKDSNPEWTKLNTSVITGTLSLEDHGTVGTLIEDQRYCYWVRATDDSGNEPELPGTYPTWDAATACLQVTKELDVDPPGAPSGLTVTVEPQGHTLTLKWTGTQVYVTGTGNQAFADPEHPDPKELTGYQIFMGSSGSVPGPPSDALGNITDLTPYTALAGADQFKFEETIKLDASGDLLLNNTQYCFKVYSVDASPTKAFLGTDEVCGTPKDTLPPSAPSLASPTSVICDDASCDLTWKTPSDIDNDPPTYTLTFDVYRCAGGASSCTSATSFTAISTEILDPVSEDPGYLDEDVAAGNYYTYCLVATDPSGNPTAGASTQAIINAAIAAGKCRVGGVGVGPACPSIVQVTGKSLDSETNLPTDAALCWNESVGPDLAGYNIYACASESGSDCIQMNTSLYTAAAPGSNCTSPVYTDEVEAPGAVLYYTVLAKDSSGLECSFETAAFDGPLTFAGSSCEGGIALKGSISISAASYSDPSATAAFPSSAGLKMKVCLGGVNVLMDGADISLSSGSFNLCLLDCVSSGDCSSKGVTDSACGSSTDLEIYVSGLKGSGLISDSNGLNKIHTVTSNKLADLTPGTDPVELDVKEKIYPAENGGDATGDGVVNIDDFLRIRTNFFVSGCEGKTGSDTACQGADFNRDGQVNIDDFLILRNHFFYQ